MLYLCAYTTSDCYRHAPFPRFHGCGRDAACSAHHHYIAIPRYILTDYDSYFNRQYIQSVLLLFSSHKKHVNLALLEKYYPVGGVRIEDCILVTAEGYENLTTAPKGEQALRIINEQ